MKKVKVYIAVVSAVIGVISFIVVTTVEIDGIKFSETYVFPLYHLLLYFLAGISLIIFFYCGIYCNIREKILRWLDKEIWLDRFAPSRGRYPKKEEIKNEKTYRRLLHGERAWRRLSWLGLSCGLIILFLGGMTPPTIKNNQYMMVFSYSERMWFEHRKCFPFLNIHCAEEVHFIFWGIYALIYLIFISSFIGSVILFLLEIISKIKIKLEAKKQR